MELIKALQTIRAVRQFKDELLPEETILAILDAGRRAPSGANAQHWTFIAIQDKEVQATLSTLGSPGAKHLAGAALVVALVSNGKFSPSIISWDLACAATYMQLAAWELGVGANVTILTDIETERSLLNIPEGYSLEWAISFGYPAQEEALTKPPKQGGRKPLEEVMRWNKW